MVNYFIMVLLYNSLINLRSQYFGHVPCLLLLAFHSYLFWQIAFVENELLLMILHNLLLQHIVSAFRCLIIKFHVDCSSLPIFIHHLDLLNYSTLLFHFLTAYWLLQ